MCILSGRRAIASVLAGAIMAATMIPVSAAPVMPNPSLTSSLPSHVTDVRWRRGGAWIGAGVAAGVILGGIAASRAAPYYAPQPYPYYGQAPAYYAPGYGYGPAPAYVEEEPVYEAPPVYAAPPARVYREPAPGNGIRQCYIVTDRDHNLGYWRPC